MTRRLGAMQRVVLETANHHRGQWIKAEDCWNTGGRPLKDSLVRSTRQAMRSLHERGLVELTTIAGRIHARITARRTQ